MLAGIHVIYLSSMIAGDKGFINVMKVIMSVLFGIITFIFIPLFFKIASKLKIAYEAFYDQIILKVIVAFCVYEAIIIFRYVCYLNL